MIFGRWYNVYEKQEAHEDCENAVGVTWITDFFQPRPRTKLQSTVVFESKKREENHLSRIFYHLVTIVPNRRSHVFFRWNNTNKRLRKYKSTADCLILFFSWPIEMQADSFTEKRQRQRHRNKKHRESQQWWGKEEECFRLCHVT